MASERTNYDEEWLTVEAAARVLHVHPTTLRRWADQGQIGVMLTPGGHRRFALSELNRFAHDRRTVYKPGRFEQLWVERALERTRREIAGPHRGGAEWLRHFDARMREKSRALGRRLMRLTLDYISTQRNEEALEMAREVGREYGREAVRAGLPLAEALEASIFFKDTLVVTALGLADDVHVRAEIRTAILRRINDILNAVQLAAAEAYEKNETSPERTAS